MCIRDRIVAHIQTEEDSLDNGKSVFVGLRYRIIVLVGIATFISGFLHIDVYKRQVQDAVILLTLFKYLLSSIVSLLSRTSIDGSMVMPGRFIDVFERNGFVTKVDFAILDQVLEYLQDGGYEIPIYYDPMIGKLIVWATNREYAIERMRRVLHEYK